MRVEVNAKCPVDHVGKAGAGDEPNVRGADDCTSMLSVSWRIGCGCGIAVAAMARAGAQPATAAPESDEPPAPAVSPVELAEAARETVRATTRWLASGVDSWFGHRPFEQGGRISHGRLDLSVLKRESEKPDPGLRLNARFRLPNIEHLGYLYVGRDNEREVVADTPRSLTRQDQLRATPAQNQSFFVGLGRTLGDRFDVRLGLRGAFKLYAQARLQWQWHLGESSLLEARQTLFWTVDDRFGSTSAVSFDHALAPDLELRWLSAATITQDLPRFVWGSSLGAHRSFGAQRTLSLELLVNGEEGSGVGALDYGAQLRWEQPLHEDWLLGNVVAGHFRPRPSVAAPRGQAWALGAGLKMRF